MDTILQKFAPILDLGVSRVTTRTGEHACPLARAGGTVLSRFDREPERSWQAIDWIGAQTVVRLLARIIDPIRIFPSLVGSASRIRGPLSVCLCQRYMLGAPLIGRLGSLQAKHGRTDDLVIPP